MKTVLQNIVLLCALVVPVSASAQISSYRVSTDDCRTIVAHEQAADVTFVPGVDVRGRKVAPADLNGGYGITAPGVVTIDIRLDLAERLGLGEGSNGEASALIAGEGVVGRVSVQGRDVYWNDSLLPINSSSALAAACRQAFTASGLPLPLSKPSD